MVTDILINLPNKRARTLGEKFAEQPIEGGIGREVLYSTTRPSWLAEAFGFFINFGYRFAMGRLQDRVFAVQVKHGVDSRVYMTVDDFICPSCGSPENIRLLVGGNIDDSNPRAPIIGFGNWDAFLTENNSVLKSLDVQQALIEKQRIRIEMLQVLERENEILKAHNEELKALNLQYEVLQDQLVSENNRMASELGQIKSFVDKKKLIKPDEVIAMNNAAESVALGKQSLENKERMLEKRGEALGVMKKETDDLERQLRDTENELRELRNRGGIGGTRNHGTGPGAGYNRPGEPIGYDSAGRPIYR